MALERETDLHGGAEEVGAGCPRAYGRVRQVSGLVIAAGAHKSGRLPTAVPVRDRAALVRPSAWIPGFP